MQQPPGAIHSWQEDKQGIFGSGLARGEKTKTIFQVWHLAFVSCQLSVVNARIWNLEAIAISSLTLLYIIWLGLGRNAVILSFTDPPTHVVASWRTTGSFPGAPTRLCRILRTTWVGAPETKGCSWKRPPPEPPARVEGNQR
ncbi:MAG: hypothetical protein GDA56_17300 [Hormoscilla sp. GM7CHS1pb]|nr:hypothetical protein [Hormoscilla sp. GM7CHS1pb]